MASLSCIQQLVVLSLVAKHASCLSVTVPLFAPSSAPTLSPSLISLSIEQDRWTDWSGTTSQNEFFFNTLNNLNQITGSPPRIRIGANSEDHTNFNPSVQFSEATFPASSATTPYPEASNIVVGDGFYECAQWLLPDTQVTWGVNFKSQNMTAAYLETKSIVKAFSSSAIKNAGITLDYIEIGNEADEYGDSASLWTSFANNITAVAKMSEYSTTKFWGGAFAGSSHSTTGYSPQGIIAAGILSSPSGSLIRAMSQHHYSGTFCFGSGGLLQSLMNKSSIRSNLDAFTPDIAATRAQGLDYVLGETNSYSCHGAPGVSNTAGAAIWALDYALHAPQIGISRLYFHEGVGYKYNLIQPITLTRSIVDGSPLSTPLPPHIQPAYYAAIIAAEAIGNSGCTRAIELSVNDTQISGYAFYVGNKLARAVLINSDAYLTTTTGTRNRTLVNLDITGIWAPTKMKVKRLSIPHADDTAGLTWGGQTYETSSGLVSGDLSVTTSNVASGVEISATEVVLVTFE